MTVSRTVCALALGMVLTLGRTVAMATGDKTVVLESAGTKLAFGIHTDRVSLDSLTDPGGAEWLAKPGDHDSFWRLAFQGPNGAAKDIGSADAKLARSEAGRERASLTWSVPLDDKAAIVAMTVRFQRGRPMSYWSLSAKLPTGWRVARADFPVIPNIKTSDGLKLAVPAGWGLEYDVKPGMSYAATYPSCVAAMQFAAFYNGGHGLYIGMHDPKANHKYFEANGRDDRVSFLCMNWPSIPKRTGGTYKVPFEAAIGVFDGDCHGATQIYREFALKAPWSKAGPVSKRPIPQWLKDTDLWLIPGAEPVRNVDLCKQASEYFGVPTSLHWYNWHEIPFDTLYPDYFPAKPRFAEGVKALRDAGFHVMPYINGRLSDPKSEFWTEEHGDKAAARQDNGDLYTEVYGSKVSLEVMCPGADGWQHKIARLVDRLVNECGVNGVYIDQICAAGADRCFDATHGHPLGGGSMWVDGYRTLLSEVRRKLPPDAIITTEEDAECWIDQFDAQLLVNTPTIPAARPVPIFPAVYSGRSLAFAFQYIAWDDIKRSLPWRAKMARAFVWGSQLGWVDVERIMAPEAAKEAEFLRNLARCRRFAHEFVVTGRFLGMLDVGGGNPRLTCEATGSMGGTYPIDTPTVIGSAWLAENGSLGVLLANMSDEERKVEVELSLKAAGIQTTTGLSTATFGPEGKLDAGPGGVLQKVSVPARSAVVVVYAPQKL